MKKLFSTLLVTVLPAFMAYLKMDDITRNEICKNVSKTVRSHFFKQKVIAVLILFVFLGVLGGFIHSGKQTVVLDYDDAYNIADTIISTSCNYAVLGVLGPFGDSSPQIAAVRGRISDIVMIDYYQQNYIFVQRNCVRVYGMDR